MTSKSIHSFHIPVMGTAFTIDTPIKIARYGISSVMSIGDDELCENMREHYAKECNKPFTPIKKWDEDYRARRITAYLDLVQDIVDEQFLALKSSDFEPGSEITKYFELLHDQHPLNQAYCDMLVLEDGDAKRQAQDALRQRIEKGSLDVNIMTKIDRNNYSKQGELLPEEFSDALAGLRGFAKSKLSAAVIFSAGFNRRLYAYVEKFDDFFPDARGWIKKKIILKVSDVRSSLTQGKFFAKKGVWVSEHRIESGLNCGGHAFATQGELLGPILEEFKQHREEMTDQLFEICNQALAHKGRSTFELKPEAKVTVQGGIGTAHEQEFLLDYYHVDATGWATPFLLVPEVTTLDDTTRDILAKATQKDLYLSAISPLGVPFNTVRTSISESKKWEKAYTDRPGSACPKGHLVSNTEFTKVPICPASTLYQKKKIEQLKQMELDEEAYKLQYEKIVQKACLCEDLAAGALVSNQINNKRALTPAVCPGPNLAYFSKISTLAEMAGHIYGRINLLNDAPRSDMFISELKMYIDYFANEIKKVLPTPTRIQLQYLHTFKTNLYEGITYYKGLIPKLMKESEKYRETMKTELAHLAAELDKLVHLHQALFSDLIPA